MEDIALLKKERDVAEYAETTPETVAERKTLPVLGPEDTVPVPFTGSTARRSATAWKDG